MLDPVGAGASWMRTTTAVGLLNSVGAQVIRGKAEPEMPSSDEEFIE